MPDMDSVADGVRLQKRFWSLGPDSPGQWQGVTVTACSSSTLMSGGGGEHVPDMDIVVGNIQLASLAHLPAAWVQQRGRGVHLHAT